MSAGSVTIFLPSLEGGGVERCFVVVANALAARGVEVSLALVRAEGPYLADVHPAVRVVDFRARRVWQAVPALVRHLRKARPGAVLSGLGHANAVAALAYRLSGSQSRLVLSEHAHLTSLLADFPGLGMRVTLALMRLTYPWAHVLVTVSNGVGEDLRRHVALPAERMVTIYNPVVDERLRRLSLMAPEHPWLLARDLPVILAAGRMIAQKDFSTLLEAFALLRRERRVRLLVLGDGELRPALEAQVRSLGLDDDVALPGFAPNPFAAMRAASLFVLSSRFEGLATVLIEALACGTPVVSTDCPSGPREVLEDGRWGALVPVSDAAALAAAMAAALDQPHRADLSARAARFSDDRAIDQYAEVLGLARDPVAAQERPL
jgi:glycosyltransferase involved in cell wall biosynthesis